MYYLKYRKKLIIMYDRLYTVDLIYVLCFVQDELVTIKENYETQISVMSDHICSLNETITKQRDEMEVLKLTKVAVRLI